MKFNNEKLDTKILKSNYEIPNSYIQFIDEVIIEGTSINLCIDTQYFDLERIFNLKIEEDSYYDIYLEYDWNKCEMNIEIVLVQDQDRKYFSYNPSKNEIKILKQEIDKYIQKIYKQTIEEFIAEEEI